MTRAQSYTLLFILFACFYADLFGQGLPVVAVYSLQYENTPTTVVKTVNDIVFSFIREQRNYRIIDLRNEPLREDLSVPEGSDFLFYGTLLSRSDGMKLELVLKGGVDQTTRIISRVYENSNKILLESRLLVRDLFDRSIALPDPPSPDETLSASTQQSSNVLIAPKQDEPYSLKKVTDLDSLSGSWQGESGIEKIMILRGGRGVAVLESGISISLELIRGENELIIRQKGSVHIRQFLDLPDAVARQAVSIVPPLEWRFLSTEDDSKLIGTSFGVVIKHDGKNILTMEPKQEKIEWSRAYR
ncbi:hypothetical protein K7J14_07815 [Treponema zuelzerae]|uniref:Uncharacterized protein n=1 Tax=Teretinema zuelzerae TaxID=156 RepID=A0AAE3EH49_9SPIR|nr:hypothetical protein [Teretinema zuelzerae]MCD1654609.1 hypothetical protein [Teretinema zuelzerae]